MMKIKTIIILILTCPVAQLTCPAAHSQGVPELRTLSHNAQLSGVMRLSGVTKTSVLTLPFIDDFSNQSPLPNPLKWQDQNVFVNRTFGIFPPTTGVATFDALDQYGNIYPTAPDNGSVFEADVLTSQTIRLDSIFEPYPKALSPADSVMLSFYFQPGGGIGSSWGGEQIGYRPANEDRLILEFYVSNGALEMWYPIWETNGMSLKEMCPICDSAQYPQQQKKFFQRVVVPVMDTNFYSKNFKFRFRAYSSINSTLKTGGGQWHIDYVYLNSGRTRNEETVSDVAFVDVPQTVLNGYTAVPFNQYDSSVVKNQLPIRITNLSVNTLSCRYQSIITDLATGAEVSKEPSSGEANANIYPYNTSGFYTNPDISVRPQPYLFTDVSSGEKEYEITYILKSGILSDLITANDTIRTRQVFGREFAFDDGSSERGVGFTSAGGLIAGRFELTHRDTLAGLNICFNKSHSNSNEVPFTIFVWTADSIPIDTVFTHQATVRYSDLNNGFIKYYFKDTFILQPGVYFWGIKQMTSQYLNIGFDQNNDASSFTKYYYYNSDMMEWEWRDFFYSGAIMVRPFFGMTLGTSNETRRTVVANSLKIYPNPVTAGSITISFARNISGAATVSVRDIGGRTVLTKRVNLVNGEANVSVQGLSRGMYVVTVQGAAGKLVIR
ncbi:MAG: T9SS type A sorting domain-containing protein [Bacteroidales bacterium]|nr:T9SS type A sorting domain-containing protein [Bacteroidales bacterium]